MSDWPIVDTGDLSAAIAEFQAALPGWWFSVCICSHSADASCCPDRKGQDAHLCEIEPFTSSFDADWCGGTLADSLRDVMRQGLAAKAKAALAEHANGEGK